MTQAREQATMLRHTLPTVLLAVCLLFGVGCSHRPERETEQTAAAEDSTPEGASRADLARDPSALLDLLPAGADAALAVADLNELVRRAMATSLADCVRDPAVAPLVDAIRKHEPSVAEIARYASFAPLVLKCVSGGAALAVRVRSRGEPPSIAGVFEIAGRESDVAGLFGMLAGFGQMSGRINRSTVNGMQATVVALHSPAVTVAWAQSDGLLYVADSAEGLHWLTSGAAELAKAIRGRAHEEPADYALKVELSGATITSLAGVDISALDAISRISVRGFVGRVVREKVRLEFDRGGEVLSALSSARLRDDLHARVPERALVSLEVAFGDEEGRPSLASSFSDLDHSLTPAIIAIVESASQAATFYWSLGRIGWYPRLGGVAMLAVSDEDALSRLDAAAFEVARGRRSFTSRAPDVEIRTLTGSNFGYVAYGVKNGVAAFGSDLLAAREVLADRGGRPPVIESDAFARLEIDLAAIADRAVEPYLPALLEMLLPSFADWFDRDLVPQGSLVGGYLGRIVAHAAVRDDALEVEAESPIGLAALALLAAFAF